MMVASAPASQRAKKGAPAAFDFGEAAKIRTPFTPGSGSAPPQLAGRTHEKRRLLDCSAQLRRGTPPASPLILWGPRGNGKTCLLFHVTNAIERVNRTAGMGSVHVVRISPKGCHSEGILRDRLLQNAPEAVAVRASRSVGGELSIGLAKGDGGRRLETESRIAPQSLDALLASMAGQQPVLLVVDEAHSLSPEMAGMLLDMDQMVRTRGLPSALVLAGTTALPALLHDCDSSLLHDYDSSFWSRLDDNALPLGLLSNKDADSEVFDAIFTPMSEARREVDDAVKRLAAAATFGYPYFTQAMGKALWQVSAWFEANGRGARIDECRYTLAERIFEGSRNRYYGLRYADMRRQGILPCAYALGVRLRNRADIGEAEVGECLRAAAPHLRLKDGRGHVIANQEDLVEAATDAVEANGLIWRPDQGRQDRWTQGIPTLSAYACRMFATNNPAAAQAISSALDV